jgi:two-component system NtrC family sensor kinase
MTQDPQSSQTPAHWQQTDRLATMGILTAGVAHELNNPIGYILSNLTSFQIYLPVFQQYFSLLQQIADCEDAMARQELRQQLNQLQQQENLQLLLDDTQSLLADSVQGALRVRDLVLDLRRFSHPDHAEFQLLEFKPLLDMALRLTRNDLKTHVTVSQDTGPEPLWLQGQPAALTQLLVNLLLNASQAIGTGAGKLRISTARLDNWLQVCIEDSGPGIADEILPHIFTPFFTTKAPGKGTGLGLSICQAIVQKHQGDISVSRSALGGAAFTLRFPLSNAPQ